MVLPSSGNQSVQSPGFYVFLELLVPKRIEVIAKFIRKLPSFLRRQLPDSFANLTDPADNEMIILGAGLHNV